MSNGKSEIFAVSEIATKIQQNVKIPEKQEFCLFFPLLYFWTPKRV